MKSLKNKSGQGLVEYGLILALVAVVAIGGLTLFNGSLTNMFDQTRKQIEGPDAVRAVKSVSELESLGYVLATDSDFTWSDDPDGYSFPGHGAVGYFTYSGGATKVIIPETLDDTPLTNYYCLFGGNSTVTAVANTTTNVSSTVSMFNSFQSPTLDVSNLHTEGVTDMHEMFTFVQTPILDLHLLDTSHVTNMSSMFNSCSSTTIDLSNFDTSNVTDMRCMFFDSGFTTLDLNSFVTDNVTDMDYMFYKSAATTIGLLSFNTENVATMMSMFEQSKATTLNLSSFDTANVTDMNSMFWGAAATTIMVNHFSTINVTDMSGMFRDTRAATLDLSSFDTTTVAGNCFQMFEDSTATIGYARTLVDQAVFDTTNGKPVGLIFSVK